MSQPVPRRDPDRVGLGLWLTFGLHLLQVPLIVVFGLVACLASGSSSGDYCILAGLFPPLLIGLSQLAYMLPAILIARRRQRRDVAKGLIIGAAITFTLNAACWGTLYLPGVFFRY